MHGSGERRGVAALDSRWVTALFAVAVAVITWDLQVITPSPGLDPSWTLGLHMAAELGLDHGTQVVFTYGPLGYLEWPLAVEGTTAATSAVYLIALRAVLAASLLRAARQSLPWIPAAVLAFAVAAITPRATGSVPLALATIWCLVALQDPAPRWARPALVYGGGALAALEILVKLNTGLTILLLVVVATVALPGSRARNVGTLLGVFAATASVLWLASGQGLGNVDDYVRSSFEVVAGYSQAMQLNDAEVPWDWAAALVLALATLAATVHVSASQPLVRRIAMLTIVALVIFSLEKFAFVRHDGGHAGAFFEGLAVVWLALRWRRPVRWVPCAAIAAIALAYFPVAGSAADFSIRPITALDQLRTLLVPVEREQAREQARAALRAGYAVDPRMIERIGDAAVDVRPWETALIWAHDLNWRPLPVLQDYQAYTPELDRLNAEALATEAGPRFILRHLGYGSSSLIGLDGRLTNFDSPLETLTMLCRFRPVLTSDAHQLLVRSSRDRCGEPRPLGTASAGYGETVAVPRGDRGEAVIAKIDGAAAQDAERLRAFLYRGAIRTIGLGEASARLAPRNAGSGLLISAPPELDFPAPFALAPNVETIAVDSEGGLGTSEGPLRIDFLALRLEPSR